MCLLFNGVTAHAPICTCRHFQHAHGMRCTLIYVQELTCNIKLCISTKYGIKRLLLGINPALATSEVLPEAPLPPMLVPSRYHDYLKAIGAIEEPTVRVHYFWGFEQRVCFIYHD